jgi:hypothetical protein
MFCLFYIKEPTLSWVLAIKINSLMIIDARAYKMPKYTKENYEQDMVTLRKAYMGYLIGTGAILSMWFLSGLYFVILV